LEPRRLEILQQSAPQRRRGGAAAQQQRLAEQSLKGRYGLLPSPGSAQQLARCDRLRLGHGGEIGVGHGREKHFS
jgi:hypothetical protein